MSSSTAIPISPALRDKFAAETQRFFIVRIVNEELVEAASGAMGSSLQSDWADMIRAVGDQAAYVLIRTGGPKQWLAIIYVPEGTRIKDKMVLAATKATLLNHLGYQFFSDEMHANDKSELSYEHYQGTLKPVSALSHHEVVRQEVHQQENAERSFRAKQRPLSMSGGYHSVSMPFSDSAISMVQRFANGSANFVELAVNNAKNGIDGVAAETVGAGQVASRLHSTEPRFTLYKYQSKAFLIYSCPDKSPQRLRMVYSTTKPSVGEQASKHGVTVTKTLEVSDPSEVTEQYLRESMQTRPMGGSGGYLSPASAAQPSWAQRRTENKPRPKSVITSAHPVYSLMGQSNRNSKKIVLPPPGAY